MLLTIQPEDCAIPAPLSIVDRAGIEPALRPSLYPNCTLLFGFLSMLAVLFPAKPSVYTPYRWH